MLRDVGIDIALGVRDRLKRQAHHLRAMHRLDLVGMDLPATAPAHDLALRLGRLPHGRARECLDICLERREAPWPERSRQNLDQIVELAVVVRLDGAKDLARQGDRLRSCRLGERSQIAAGEMEHVADGTIAVVAALIDAIGQIEQPPHQRESFLRIVLGNQIGDRSALHLQIGRKRLHPVPFDMRARPGDGGEPLSHLVRDLAWALGTGELEPEPPLGGGIARGELDQKLGQPCRTESLEILRVQGRLRRHRQHPLS